MTDQTQVPHEEHEGATRRHRPVPADQDGAARDSPPWSQIVQPKLVVGDEDDPAEREADHVADAVVAADESPEPAGHVPAPDDAREVQVTQAAIAGAGEAEQPLQMAPAPGSRNPLRMATTSPGPADDWQDRVRDGLSGAGRPLTPEERDAVERRTGVDLGGVRLHNDAGADAAARAIGARAFTVGRDIAFRTGEYRPHTSAGKRLLAHELTHVAQQRGGGLQAPSRGLVRRAIRPEDVASELVGRQFELSTAVVVSGTTLAAGTKVTVTAWDNAKETVEVTAAGVAGTFTVAKTLLRPVRAAVAGVHPYSADVGGQAAAVAKGEKDLADWLAKAALYTKPKAVALFAKERTRLEDLLAKRRQVLNRKLIQETMFNRFDAVITSEVATANKAHGLAGKDALDPNLVKAMLFQESELGTSGTHLEDPPSHPVKSRFNLGQVVDSSGMALLKVLEAEHPAIVTARGIGSLRSDLAAAQTELAKLKAKKSRTPAEEARLTTLTTLSKQSWENFVWAYTGFADAVNDLFSGASPARNLDYDFWIHVAVLWLFEKHKAGMTWEQAVKAYNGSGARAEHYRKAVASRAAAAATAATSGTPFTPTH